MENLPCYKKVKRKKEKVKVKKLPRGLSIEKRPGYIYDRVEFSDYISMERSRFGDKKRTTIYYCHPYCSSERGTNERMNREIRRKFPKGTNFSRVSIDKIAEVEQWLNNYPRGILGYDTPENVFNACLSKIS